MNRFARYCVDDQDQHPLLGLCAVTCVKLDLRRSGEGEGGGLPRHASLSSLDGRAPAEQRCQEHARL